jgi:hypothetical protein
MQTRRDFLSKLGIGAAAAAAGAGSIKAADAIHRDTLRAFAEGGGAAHEPWWLVSPLQPGTSVGKGWHVASLSKVERGAAVLELAHRDGQLARLHVCAHAGKPRGMAHTALFDLILMDGGQGDQPTPEGLGRALVGVANRIRRNEVIGEDDLKSVSRMLTHTERVELYGPETLT